MMRENLRSPVAASLGESEATTAQTGEKTA